ncbi:hypothetical protein ACRAVF_22395 [Bradyrhizobium oligotrophicum S58]
MFFDKGRILMLVALCASAPARSEQQCPELTRLQAEADAAWSKIAGLSTPEHCHAYVQFSIAWADVERYARKHRESCGVSAALLADIERRHRDAVNQRINACGGPRESTESKGRRNLFPPEVRPRW